MSRQGDRGYKIVYKTRTRDEPRSQQYGAPLSQTSSRASEASFDSRRPPRSRPSDDDYAVASPRPRVPDEDYTVVSPRSRTPDDNYAIASPRSRVPDDDYAVRREYSDNYGRSDGVIVIETPRRRSPARYAIETPYDRGREEPRRRAYDRGRAEPVAPRSRPGPPPPQASFVRTRPSKNSSDISDDGWRTESRQNPDPGWTQPRDPPPQLRSAMRGSRTQSPNGYRPRLTRTRSISFTEKEASMHDVGTESSLKHERPGAEARVLGRYLGHDDIDDLASESYPLRATSGRSGGTRRSYE